MFKLQYSYETLITPFMTHGGIHDGNFGNIEGVLDVVISLIICVPHISKLTSPSIYNFLWKVE
jgi:hypothetical protein